MRGEGGLIGFNRTATTTAASGIWTVREAEALRRAGEWPRGPLAPTSLTAAAGDAQLSLSWTAPATTHGTITNYLVEYTPSGGSAATVLTGSTSASYTLTGLTNGNSYTVRVAAVNFTAGDYSGTASGTPNNGVTINYLVVGGGAGGGTGGGGAGGFLTGTAFVNGIYAVTVGAGGAAGFDASCGDECSYFVPPANGANSVFAGLTAFGGGRGGSDTTYPANSGGSGGGGRFGGTGASGTTGQGNAGGSGGGQPGMANGGGGAGAAGQSGCSGSGCSGGKGGDGLSSTITGGSSFYAGGGGGANWGSFTNFGTGGLGGGGNSKTGGGSGGTNGTANTGGGGGGDPSSKGTVGGSGVVIIRSPRAAAATTGSPTVSTIGADTVYVFTGTGSITF